MGKALDAAIAQQTSKREVAEAKAALVRELEAYQEEQRERLRHGREEQAARLEQGLLTIPETVQSAVESAVSEAVGTSKAAILESLPSEVAAYIKANPPKPGKAGTDGSDGSGFTWRGRWSSRSTYQPLHVVEYEGSAYVALRPTKGDRPGVKGGPWDLMVRAGQDTSGPRYIPRGGGGGSGSGEPTGPAGGDLSGTYPNPSVQDDSHSHTAGTLPPLGGGTPTLAEVLLEGNDAEDQNLTNVGQVQGAPEFVGWNPAKVQFTGVSGVRVYGGDADGAFVGAQVDAGVGTETEHGKVSIRTDGSTGTAGQVLTSDGTDATWEDAAGGDYTYVQVAEPMGTEGQTWLQLPPDIVIPDSWVADTPFATGLLVQPPTPNDHYYKAEPGGTSGSVDPGPWPTDGSSIPDNDILWADQGELGPVDVHTFQPWRHDGVSWEKVGISAIVDGEIDLETFDTNGRVKSIVVLGGGVNITAKHTSTGFNKGQIEVGSSDANFAHFKSDATGTLVSQVYLDDDGIYLGTTTATYTGATLKVRSSDGLILVTVPNADPGVAGAIYSDGTPGAADPKPLMVSGG